MHPEAVSLLRIQYRMNDDIMRFSSDYFYGGRVESAPEVKFRSILDLDTAIEWRDTHLMDNEKLVINNYDYTGSNDAKAESETADSMPSSNHNYSLPITNYSFKEEFVGENFGRINKAEAELTLLTLQRYFERIGKQRLIDERIDVGIISPYRAQVQLLRRMLMKSEYFKPFRRMISVNTVDGFQGQERDIIVISMVRSNDEGQIGFLRDLRRMNVAITRARMKLIILGDRQTLTRHPFYRKLWMYIQNLNS
jgi:superfamily I DNA and/or RNA helicase